MYTPSQMRLLRIAVVVMGVILLLGFATVIGRIVYLLNTAPKPVGARIQDGSEIAAPLTAPPSIELPTGAVVKHMALSGNRLAIHYESASGAGIRIVDIASPQQSITVPIVEADPR
jgi:hypothetical protein